MKRDRDWYLIGLTSVLFVLMSVFAGVAWYVNSR